MEKPSSLRKGLRMHTIVKCLAVAAAFLLLGAVSVLARTQSNPPSPAQTPNRVAPTARPKKRTPPPDDFAGLTFTDEQKAKIEQIRQAMKLRMDAVVKDDKLNADQKQAMQLHSLTNLLNLRFLLIRECQSGKIV